MTAIVLNSLQYHTNGWTFGSGCARTAGVGQNGLPGLRCSIGANSSCNLGYASLTHIIVGFAYTFTELSAEAPFIQFHLTSGNPIFELRAGIDGSVVAVEAAGTDVEIGRSTSGYLNVNTPVYVEVRVLFSTTVGEVEVRLNGDPTPVLNLTNVDTGSSSSTYFQLFHNPVNGVQVWSAPYVLEVDATAPNDFLGHLRYAALDPVGNGNSSQLVGSDSNSTDNYLLVDDGAAGMTNDGGTTYVQSSTPGEQDTYTLEDMPTPALSVVAVVPVLIAAKSDAGTRSIKPVVRSGGTDYDGDEAFLGLSYAAFPSIMLEDPDTAAPWADAGINAIELGVKVAS